MDIEETAPEHHILIGHNPYACLEGSDIEGVDFLLQEWIGPTGTVTRELAMRPGHERRDLTWSPPTTLIAEGC